MKMFANENLFEPIIDYLESLGHDVISIRDSGLSGISDDEVYKRACNEKQVIITMDKDFSRIFRFPPEKCGGIIVVKIYKRTVDETLSIFKKFYGSIQEKDILENLVIITAEGVRIRRSKR
jgi:predicted nuclease of predicted toxin-antitoxin system